MSQTYQICEVMVMLPSLGTITTDGAGTASLTSLQQAMHDAVNDAIRNALKPGGAIWVQQRGR